MAFDPGLAERLEAMCGGHPGMQQKRMFGGIGWLLNGNMCVGVYKHYLIARVGDEAAVPLLSRPHVKPMDITGRPMRGWVMIAPEGYEDDADLQAVATAAIRHASSLPVKDPSSPVGDHPARADRRDPAGERRRTGERQARTPGRRR